MDSSMITPIVLIGFGLFAGGMFAYRKMTAGETFELMKFLPMMGYGAIAALVLYLASGSLPSIDAIFTYIEVLAPGGAPSVAVIIAAILTIVNGFVNATKTANLSGSKVVAATATVTEVTTVKVGDRIKLANGKYAIVGVDPTGQRTFTYDDGTVIDCAGSVLKPAPATGITPPAVVLPPITTDPFPVLMKLPTSTIYNPALHGGLGPNMVSWDQMRMWVLFKVNDETKKNLLSGISNPEDAKEILAGIAKAEETNEYYYSIDFGSGYYNMKAVCSPIGTNEYQYTVVAAQSGLDKQ